MRGRFGSPSRTNPGSTATGASASPRSTDHGPELCLRRHHPNTPTGQIAVHVPAAIPVFQRLGIDFCCAGAAPLAETVQRADARLDEVLTELLALSPNPGDRDWSTAPLDDLIDHIVSTHHGATKKMMPALWERLREVLQTHGENHPELHEVGKILAPLFTELGQHLQKEEQILFPTIRRLSSDASANSDSPEGPMSAMEHEHDNAGEAFRKLREITDGFRAPEDADDSYRTLYAGLHELERDLHVHIHLENNVLHPRTREMCEG